MTQPSSSVLFREIHKNAWLKLLPSQKIAKISPHVKRGMKVWVVFCVHDDVDPFLEFYTTQEQSPLHKPMQSVPLNATLHVSPTICAQEDEFEFVVTLQSDIVRLTASSWEQMMEWVEGIQAKLREMRILSPKENLYSKMPEQRPPLLPTRDPNSPLPLPPLGPSSLLPGVEPVLHADTDRNQPPAVPVLSPLQMGMIAPSTESSEYTRGLQRLVSRVSSLADPPDLPLPSSVPPPSPSIPPSPTHNVTVIEVNASDPSTSFNSNPQSSNQSSQSNNSHQNLPSNPLGNAASNQTTPQPSTSRDENVFNFAFVNEALTSTEDPDVFFTPPATPGLPGSMARCINPLGSLTDPFAPLGNSATSSGAIDPFAPRASSHLESKSMSGGIERDPWDEDVVWDCREEEVRVWDCREDGTPVIPAVSSSPVVSVSSNSHVNVVTLPSSTQSSAQPASSVSVITQSASATCLTFSNTSSSVSNSGSNVSSSNDSRSKVYSPPLNSTSPPVSSHSVVASGNSHRVNASSNEDSSPVCSTSTAGVSNCNSITPIINPKSMQPPVSNSKSTTPAVLNPKPIPPPLSIPKSTVKLVSNTNATGQPLSNHNSTPPHIPNPKSAAQAISNSKSTAVPIASPKSSTQPISNPKSTAQPISTPKSTAQPISNPKSTAQPISSPKSTAQPILNPKSTSQPIPNPKSTSQPIPNPKSTSQPIPNPKSTSQPLPNSKSTSPTPTSPMPLVRKNSAEHNSDVNSNGHNLYEHLFLASDVRSGNTATPAEINTNSQANNIVRSRPSARSAVNPQPNRPRRRSSSNSEPTGHLPHVPADRIRAVSQRTSEQVVPQRIGSAPVIPTQTSSSPDAPLVNPSRLTLREQQVLQLRREMMHPGGVRLQLKRKDCVSSIALVDAFNAVWIAGWKQIEHPMLYGALHIGDQVLKIMGQPVHNAAEAQKLIRSKHGIYVEFVILRVPRGRVYAICREHQGQSLGIVQDGTAEIKDVLPGSLVQQNGIPQKTTTMDGLGLTTWWITEINGRPLNLFFKDNEVKDRLNCVGLDISLLIQPFDLIKQMKKQMKSSIRSYKDYIVQ